MNPCQNFLSTILIATAIVLSMATNLRVEIGLYKVGPGELALMGLAFWGLVDRRVLDALKNPVLWFWGLLLTTMSLGYLTGNIVGEWTARNTTAYLFTFFVTFGIACVLVRLSDEKLTELILWVVFLATLFTWVGFVFFIFGTEDTTRWIGLTQLDQRYSAWSSSPNQLALFFLPLPIFFMAAQFRKRGYFNGKNLPEILFFYLTLLMGFLVRSDALLLSWAAGFVIWIIFKLMREKRNSLYFVLIIGIVFLAAFATVKNFASSQVQGDVRCAITKVFATERFRSDCEIAGWQNGRMALTLGFAEPERKKSIRLDLWSNGLSAWFKAPLFGHGPGAYARYSNAEDQRDLERSGRSYEEAHSTPIDLLTQGGVFLALGWVCLLVWLLFKAWKIRDPYTFSVIVMIGVFSLFHYHVRQPYLWFVLLISYEAIRRRLFVTKPLVE